MPDSQGYLYKSDLRIYTKGKQRGIIRIKHFKTLKNILIKVSRIVL